MSLLVPFLELAPPAAASIDRALRAGFLLVLFWALLRAVDVAAAGLAEAPWAMGHQGSRSLLSIAGRVAKVIVAALAAVAALSELGYPVGGLLAGLGLGGLAFALAAQKTVENLFGALAIGLDQQVRDGDFVRVEDLVGTVEAVGLRSTRDPDARPDPGVASPTAGSRTCGSSRSQPGTAFASSASSGLSTRRPRTRCAPCWAGLERALRGPPADLADAVVVRFEQLRGLLARHRGHGLVPDLRLERVPGNPSGACSCVSWRSSRWPGRPWRSPPGPSTWPGKALAVCGTALRTALVTGVTGRALSRASRCRAGQGRQLRWVLGAVGLILPSSSAQTAAATSAAARARSCSRRATSGPRQSPS